IWIVLGYLIINYMLQKLMINRIKNFNVEEISTGRDAPKEISDFKKNVKILGVIPLVYAAGLIMIFAKIFIIGSVLLVSAHLIKNLILINSYNKNKLNSYN
ncbi:MAG: hypothetical protein ABF868_05055, partial [Sporolactobacillus sp.]